MTNGFIVTIDAKLSNAMMLTGYFKSKGYGAENASRGDNGLAQVQTLAPDLLIIDPALPDMDGFQLIRQIRKIPLLQHLYIIVLSDKHGREHRIKALRAGADDYLTKPVDIQELLLRVEMRLLRQRNRTRILQSESVNPSSPIFIAYSDRDWTDYVEPLTQQLAEHDIPFWVDMLVTGLDNRIQAINVAVQDAAKMVVCLSPNALASRHIRLLYRYALDNGMRVYPLLCREVELSAELRALPIYDYSELEPLIAALK